MGNKNHFGNIAFHSISIPLLILVSFFINQTVTGQQAGALDGVVLSDLTVLKGRTVKSYSPGGVVLDNDENYRWDQIYSAQCKPSEQVGFQKSLDTFSPLWKKIYFRLAIGQKFEVSETLDRLEPLYRSDQSDQALVLCFLKSRNALWNSQFSKAVDAHVDLLRRVSAEADITEFQKVIQRWAGGPENTKKWLEGLPEGDWGQPFLPYPALMIDLSVPPVWVTSNEAKSFCQQCEKWFKLNVEQRKKGTAIERAVTTVYFCSAAIASADIDFIRSASRKLKNLRSEIIQELKELELKPQGAMASFLKATAELDRAVTDCIKVENGDSLTKLVRPDRMHLYKKNPEKLLGLVWVGQAMLRSPNSEVVNRGRVRLMAAAYCCRPKWRRLKASCLLMVSRSYDGQKQRDMEVLVKQQFPEVSFTSRSVKR